TAPGKKSPIARRDSAGLRISATSAVTASSAAAGVNPAPDSNMNPNACGITRPVALSPCPLSPRMLPVKTPAARSTTILSVRRGDQVALGGDGQVTLGNVVAKADAIKIRRVGPGGKVLLGFAGSAADGFALLERLEKKLG